MDSINQNQIEENHQDLRQCAAIAKIKELVEKSGSCFFCTEEPTADSSHGARPMSVRQVTDDGVLWFLSPSDSHKNEEISHHSRVRLYFQGSSHSDFLLVEGRATILRDKAKIQELWNPLIRTWFTEGVDDPRITVIKVEPTGGYYWDTKHGKLVSGVKIMLGALTGRTMDDSIEGNLSVTP